jgi:hypothetical protein
MYGYGGTPKRTIDLGEGFLAKTSNKEYLEKHNLLGKGVLHFVNTLCVLVDEKKDELPEAEWDSLDYTLRHLMVAYENGHLYFYLLNTHGADAINYNAWAHFSLDTLWGVCVQTFTDMPTAVIEEYGVRHWKRRSRTLGKNGYNSVMKAIEARTDIYGSGSLPSQMVAGILFDQEAAEKLSY